MDLTQTSKCDAELWGHSKVVMVQPLDITDLHHLPLLKSASSSSACGSSSHTLNTRQNICSPDDSVVHSSWLTLGLPPPLPSRPEFWALDAFIDVITSDFWSLITFQQAAFSGLSTGDAGVWRKLTHPHLHFHIFIARWENYRIA